MQYGEDGQRARALLIYVKSCKPGVLPTALQHFAETHAAFPHTPTTDQFFTETDFESYREIGRILGGNAAPQVAGALDPLPQPGA